MSLNINSAIYVPSENLLKRIKNKNDLEIIKNKKVINEKIVSLRVMLLKNYPSYHKNLENNNHHHQSNLSTDKYFDKLEIEWYESNKYMIE